MQRRYILIAALILLILGLVIYHFVRNAKDTSALTLYGNVDVRQVDLGFRVAGRVVTMIYEEGDFVPKGKLMAIMEKQPYADQVLQAAAGVESARISLQNAEKVYTRRTELISEGGVSAEDYENTQSNKDVLAANLKQAEAGLGVAVKNLQDTEIFSPTDGTILTRIREPGTVVKEGDPIYTLSIISPVWVRAFVSEPDLGRVYPGMPAEILTDSGSTVYKGHVGFISPVSEFTPKTVETTQLRTDLVYRLRVVADNPDKGLRQGMPVTVRLLLQEESGG